MTSVALRFDIPRQPLHDALQEYSRITGRSLLYDTAQADGRWSVAVAGMLTPEDALRRLVAGSGLTVRYTSTDAFVLMPVPDEALPAAATGSAAAQDTYFTQVQARVLRALCGDAGTRPGAYRLALRFRIGNGDAIDRLEVHATGRPALEAAVRQRLAYLPVGAPPPGMGQPITLLVLPSAESGGAGCPQ